MVLMMITAMSAWHNQFYLAANFASNCHVVVRCGDGIDSLKRFLMSVCIPYSSQYILLLVHRKKMILHNNQQEMMTDL